MQFGDPYHRLTALFLAGVSVVACRPSPATARAVETAATLAANPDQQRLWRDADQGLAVGLERLAIVEQPVAARRQPGPTAPPPQAPGGGQPAPQSSPPVIPPEVQNQLRIVSAPQVGAGFTGAANVTAAADDQLTLTLVGLGQPNQLVVLARAAGNPLALLKQQVRLTYIPRRNPRVPDETLVIYANGRGIGRVVQSGVKPLTVKVDFFGVVATHDGAPDIWSVTVNASGAPAQTLRAGQTAQLGNVFVMLVGTYARPADRPAPSGGAPYLINLLVWSP